MGPPGVTDATIHGTRLVASVRLSSSTRANVAGGRSAPPGDGETAGYRDGAMRCWYGVPAHMTYGTEVSGSAFFG